MKKIHFTTARGVGYVEIPEDTTSIRIPEGICENCGEEPLRYNEAEDNEEEGTDDHRITIAGGDDDNEVLMPNI